jgi:hypothetical protein
MSLHYSPPSISFVSFSQLPSLRKVSNLSKGASTMKVKTSVKAGLLASNRCETFKR